ncbi:hypothetical protein ACF3MZ_06995 [Paenibacillaceae bacterium WGS1546]|uniref:hypothetical protein n=1 Tax=Cohnella sp. WGS1546 TaxID=3366810 RepID=UPI00372D1F3D
MPGNRLLPWGMLALSGIVVVLLLGRLPEADRQLQHRKAAVEAFRANQAKWLTDENLVGAVVGLELRGRVLKIGWDHGILTVDMNGYDPDGAWDDIGKLIVYAYAETINVKQLLVRVYGDRGGSRTLLLAADTRKEDWPPQDLEALKRAEGRTESAIGARIRLTVSPSGRRWLENFANS